MNALSSESMDQVSGGSIFDGLAAIGDFIAGFIEGIEQYNNGK